MNIYVPMYVVCMYIYVPICYVGRLYSKVIIPFNRPFVLARRNLICCKFISKKTRSPEFQVNLC